MLNLIQRRGAEIAWSPEGKLAKNVRSAIATPSDYRASLYQRPLATMSVVSRDSVHPEYWKPSRSVAVFSNGRYMTTGFSAGLKVSEFSVWPSYRSHPSIERRFAVSPSCGHHCAVK